MKDAGFVAAAFDNCSLENTLSLSLESRKDIIERRCKPHNVDKEKWHLSPWVSLLWATCKPNDFHFSNTGLSSLYAVLRMSGILSLYAVIRMPWKRKLQCVLLCGVLEGRATYADLVVSMKSESTAWGGVQLDSSCEKKRRKPGMKIHAEQLKPA